MHRQGWLASCGERGHRGGLRSAAVRREKAAVSEYCDMVLQDFNDKMWKSNRILKEMKMKKKENEALERADYLVDKVADAQQIGVLLEDYQTTVGLDASHAVGITGLQHITVAACRELPRHNRKHWDNHVPLRKKEIICS
jgi:hypothetical protein